MHIKSLLESVYLNMEHELQNALIREILNLKDVKALQLLQDVMDTLKLPNPYPISPELADAIDEAEAQVERGEVVSHDEVMDRAQEWLDSK